MDPCQVSTSVLCLHYRPETVQCSTKDAYTSEKTFLALHPWSHVNNRQCKKTNIFTHFTYSLNILRTL